MKLLSERKQNLSVFRGACLAFAILFSLSSHAQKGPNTLNVSGGLFLPSGLPVTSANVNFRLEIWDKASTCMLYTENHLNQNLSQSKGGFSLGVGRGSNPTNLMDSGSPTALSAKVFENGGIIAGGWANCPSGANLVPGDERVIRVAYDLGGGFVAMTPDVPIESAAYAMVAESLQGKTPDNFVQVRDDMTYDLNQANIENVFSATNYARLQQLLNPSAAIPFAGQRLSNIADPTSAQDAVTRNYADGRLAGQAIDLGNVAPGAGGGKVLTWDQSANKWVAMAPSMIDNTKLPLAGGTMSGAIDMAGQNINNAGNIAMNAGKTLNLGTFNNATEGALGLGATDAGKFWYNTQAGTLKVWNGTTAVPQAYLTAGKLDSSWIPSTTVTGAAYGSATQVPTFTVGADGRLTAAANVTIAGVAPGGAAGGDLTGMYPNPIIGDLAVGTSKLSNNAVTSAKINSTGVDTNRLLITDGTTGATVTYANCANNEILKFMVGTGWQCATVSSLSAVTSVAGKSGAVTLNAMDINGLGTAALYDVGIGATQIPVLDGGAKLAVSMIPNFAGDITGAYSNAFVSRLQGRDLSANAPNTNEVLMWNGSTWFPTLMVDAGITALTGDISAAGSGSVAATLTNGVVTTPKMFSNPGVNRLIATDSSTGATLAPFVCNLTEIMQWTASGWACVSVSSAIGSGVIVNNGNTIAAPITVGLMMYSLCSWKLAILLVWRYSPTVKWVSARQLL